MTVRSRRLATALLAIALIGWAAFLATDATLWASDSYEPGHPVHFWAAIALVLLSFAVIAMYAVNHLREGQARITTRLDDLVEKVDALISTGPAASERESATAEIPRLPVPVVRPRAVATAPVPGGGTLVMAAHAFEQEKPPGPRRSGRRRRASSPSRSPQRDQGGRRATPRKAAGGGRPRPATDPGPDRAQPDPNYPWDAYLAGRADEAEDGGAATG